MAGFYDFASAFIVRQYGPCPDPKQDPEGEERWHARLGLVTHALGEFQQSMKVYTVSEIKTLAREFLQQSPLTDKLTPELILSSLIAWLARREKDVETKP